jgi:uncharacterized damage-inducible protein DinB
MGQGRLTASAIISFSKELEEDTRRFYEEMAEAYPQGREAFLAFAKEAQKGWALISRTYQETVSDAMETGFSFEGLDLTYYQAEKDMRAKGYVEALKKALKLEEAAVRFYSDVAERASSFLATMPKAFRKVAEMREARRKRIQALLDNLGIRKENFKPLSSP